MKYIEVLPDYTIHQSNIQREKKRHWQLNGDVANSSWNSVYKNWKITRLRWTYTIYWGKNFFFVGFGGEEKFIL